MSSVSKISTLCLITVYIVLVLGSPTGDKSDKKCSSDFCKTAKFKCMSSDSCNGTLLPSTDPCSCCPSCITFNGEGEVCEDENAEPAAGVSTPKTEAEDVSKDHSTRSLKACKPGLLCLSGVCVVLL